MVTFDPPPFPRDLSSEARLAMTRTIARDFLENALRESGDTLSQAARDALVADAMNAVAMAWLAERVEALEAGIEALRKPRKQKGTSA